MGNVFVALFLGYAVIAGIVAFFEYRDGEDGYACMFNYIAAVIGGAVILTLAAAVSV